MILNQPGSGWGRLAEHVATTMPVSSVDGVWQFRTLKHDGREFGTALLSVIDGDLGEKRRIFTARFMMIMKGKERGKFEATLEEVGQGPVETFEELLAGVRKRIEDEDPRLVPVADWFAQADGTTRVG
jgi:hypothetical protein